MVSTVVACVCVAAGAAAASAWNRPAGSGLVIVGGTTDAGDTFYDRTGRLAPARRYDKAEASAYVEYGATDQVTLLARTAFDRVVLAPPDGGRYAGPAGASVGAQWQALTFGPAVLAVQTTVGLPGSTSRDEPALVGNTSREAELRLLGGLGLPVRFAPFLDLEAAYRLRSGGAAPEWHADLTFGLHPTDRLLLLGRSRTVLRDRSGVGTGPSGWATRLEVEAVYDVSSAWAVSVGAFETVAGRESLRERGLDAGIWHRF